VSSIRDFKLIDSFHDLTFENIVIHSSIVYKNMSIIYTQEAIDTQNTNDHCLPCNLRRTHLLLYKHPCSSCPNASTQSKWHQWKLSMYLSVLASWVKRLTRKKAACLTHRQQFNVPWHQLNNVYLSLSLSLSLCKN
jgi:hypothetical protein